MSLPTNSAVENRLGVPSVLLSLCLVTLLVSLFGLFRTSGVTQTRFDDLQASWEVLVDGGIEGAEIVVTDRLLKSVSKPVPAIHSAASWSLAMGSLSLVFLAWHLLSIRSLQRRRNMVDRQLARNDEAALAKLLDEIAPLASGDLNVRATARDGAAGALADAFNHSVSELQRLTELQLSTSRSLGEYINQSHELALAIKQQSSQQIGYIHQSSNILLSMSSSTGAMSANTVDTSVATQAIANSADSVANTFEENTKEIDRMRRDSDASIMLLRSIEQHGGSIDDVVVLLRDLAQQTDLLAMNTTIRASSSGTDRGSENLSRLTDEVARLAAALCRAVDEVSSSTRSMKADTSEAIKYVQDLYSRCDAQSTQTRALADTLLQIRTQSQTANMHAGYMAKQAVSHAGVVKDLSKNINSMNAIIELTGKDAQINMVSMEGLKKIASDLRQSAAIFNLPENRHLASVDSSQFKSVARRAAERAAING